VRLRGLDFAVRVEGDPGAEPVVLLHGFPQHSGSWDRTWPELAGAGYRTVLLDQRGYSPGARPAGRRAYAITEVAADVLALLDELGVERAHVVGHDWGGAVGWHLAATVPDRLLSLTSVSTPHPRALLRSMVTSDQALRSWYMAFFQLPVLPEKALLAREGRRFHRALRRAGLPPGTDYVDRLRADGALTATLNWYRAIPYGLGRAPRPVSTPTLLVWGDRDPALGPAAAAATARYVTGPYTFVRLPGVGHWIPETAPAALLGPLLDHLRRYSS
jgi:pimeloyl-ACP methyl ester carboxylesterase